ncbi:MAG: sugar phosphate isomerase/epimerase [Clostridiales bacterium]|nr:sugar phosphate isomerase/epimerase [Clostridiales bacterium]
MKISFSTLGCPRWTWNEVFSTAKDLGFDGVEIRGLGDELYAPSIKEFREDAIEETGRKLERLGLKIPVLSSGAVLAVDEKADASSDEAKAYIDLASKLGTPYVRVMGTGEPDITAGNFRGAAARYHDLCEYASDKGVIPLIETNGALSASDAMIAFLRAANTENSGVLWDVHHTVRIGEECVSQTVEVLGSRIKHIHVKDSEVVDGRLEYRMMGYGDIPVFDAVRALKDIGYDGFISLEWVKRWNPDLQEPGIVFAHYVSYIKMLLDM